MIKTKQEFAEIASAAFYDYSQDRISFEEMLKKVNRANRELYELGIMPRLIMGKHV